MTFGLFEMFAALEFEDNDLRRASVFDDRSGDVGSGDSRVADANAVVVAGGQNFKLNRIAFVFVGD